MAHVAHPPSTPSHRLFFPLSRRISIMDFGGGGAGGGRGASQQDVEQLQQSLQAVTLQLLQNQVRKTCFDKCFGNRFPDRMSKTEHICLAKCMDRMYEAHAIVVKASVEMAQNINSQPEN
eukprot:gnl/TRDRNA2_/TRDRNA2_37899_c0_seq1.p1 gnl/TRDRNA2_/TRDRNA2_37899_c0~~gnl/TRDRNA2_/TRDRNA2_37899_c0_seq1.p1  ORF type:complete len:120 (-),score=20.71 gnl/TRDRNA2_/TRDRNA2_37899_c0_seq1:241-600(-)